jgi:voltage-gated potassium channel
MKKRIYEILEVAKRGDKASRAFDIFLITLISLNVLSVILGTVAKLSIRYSHFFRMFEVFSVLVFTVEYVLRVWSCTMNPKYKNPIYGRLRYIFSPMAFVDFLAILPFYLPRLISVDLRFLRALRLMRTFRLLKVQRYSEGMKLFGRVLKAKKEELFVAVFAIVVLLVISSSLMFYVEYHAQPAVFSNIPASLWWGISTLTTVGYGDIYPITPWGKVLGGVISLLGVSLFAMPTGILSAGFIAETKKKNTREACPHCGGRLE